MTIKARRGFFLGNTGLARVGLHGGLLKDDAGHIEVGPGFAEAVERINAQSEPTPTPAPAEEKDDNPPADDNPGDDGAAGDDDQDEGDGKRGTAKYIRELKRDLKEQKRERERERREFDARIAAVEKRGLTGNEIVDTNKPTSAKPDVSDVSKYPLGVLDDSYITDMIDWRADEKIREHFDGQRNADIARNAQQQQQEAARAVMSKVDDLCARGEDLDEDYREKVLEAGLQKRYLLEEATFDAAYEAKHGAEILLNLANDPKEAERVAKLSISGQVKFVLEKNEEIAAKRKGRSKPQAEDLPDDAPRGRSSSTAIRPDTDNLDDFRKIFYKK